MTQILSEGITGNKLSIENWENYLQVRWASYFYALQGMSEWVIKFKGLSGDSRQQGPYSRYKPCNHSLCIGIIISPHIEDTQSKGHN